MSELDSVRDRLEANDKAINIRLKHLPDQCAVTAHTVTCDRSDALLDVPIKALLNKLNELFSNVAVHSVVVLVGRGG